jgi:HTH-type transcriptional regulator, competence development regulator
MSTTELGARLKEVRDLRNLSLKAVAEPADISAAYLQKLERGEVKAPSPHILHRLSQVLAVPYQQLMELAGYVVPSADSETTPRGNLLAHALSSEDITEDEAQELARYLSWYRHQRNQPRTPPPNARGSRQRG